MDPVSYVKAAVLGRLQRARQISGDDDASLRNFIWRLLMELTDDDHGFTWNVVFRAVSGIRAPWANHALRQIRDEARRLAALQRREG